MALVVYNPHQTLGVGVTSGEISDNEPKFSGLSNQGATCYLNGLLQTLYMTPEFRRAIFTWNYDTQKDGPEDLCIPLQLQRLFGLLQLSKQRAVDTVALTKSFGWEGSEVFQQQDVQELTRVLFDALEQSFKGTAAEHLIDELYAGELVDYLRCVDVDYRSERTDKFLDFSLAIVPFGSTTPLRTLTECIESYLRPEILSGGDQYFCEAVGRKVDAIKGLKFGRLPRLMSVQLKRFVYDFSGASIVQKKLNDAVRFPMVLDMNKYVAPAASSSGGEGGEQQQPANQEFEAFLKEQLDLLTNPPAPPSEEATADGAALAPEQQQQQPEEEDDDDIPALTDYTGRPSPDQVEADRAKAARKQREEQEEEARQRERVAYGSMGDAEVQRLVTARGEWVYELYAVLIHSGAISGGHYYAYIRDLASRRWFEFNDSSVSPIGEATVQEAWGGAVPATSSSSSLLGRPASTRLSSANAYMLMYRKVAPAAADVSSAVRFPADEEVPQYIRDLLRAQEEKRLRKEREEEELRNRLHVKVLWGGREHVVPASRTSTLRELLEATYRQLNLRQHLLEEDAMDAPAAQEAAGPAKSEGDEAAGTSTAVDAESLLFSRFRLRLFNPNSKMRTEVFDCAAGDRTLASLFVSEFKVYAVETRGAHEAFELYHAEGLSLGLEPFHRDSDHFGEVLSVRMPKGSTLADLKAYVAKLPSLQWPAETVQVLKIINCGLTEARMEVLSEETRRLKEDYLLYDGQRLFVEQMDAPAELSSDDGSASSESDARPAEPVRAAAPASRAYLAYMETRNKIDLLVNKPPGTAFEHLVSADMRWKVGELRRRVVEVLGLEAGTDIRMFKLNSRGQELKDGELSLSSNAIYGGCSVFVALGKATPAGFFQLAISEYLAPECRAGVVALPALEPEEALPEPPKKAPPSAMDCMANAKKNWAAAATATLADIHVSIDRIEAGDREEEQLEAVSGPRVPLVLPQHAAGSSAAATASRYNSLSRHAEEGDDEEEDRLSTEGLADEEAAYSSDEAEFAVHPSGCLEVAEAGAAENIHNLMGTRELSALPEVAVLAEDAEESASLTDALEAVQLQVEEEQLVTAQVSITASGDLDFLNSVAAASDVIELPPSAASALTPSSDSAVDIAGVAPVGGGSVEDVEPSNFGEIAVRNSAANTFTDLPELGDVAAQNSTPLSELRAQLAARLIAMGRLPEGASPNRVRIRDKLGSHPGRILRDGKTVAENRLYLFDHKPLCVQLLAAEEVLPEEETGDVLIQVQRWQRATWSLGERFEVLLPGAMTVRDVARSLGRLTGVPLDSMLAMVVPRDTEFLLSELCKKSPARNFGRAWFDPSRETKPLKFMSHEMRLQDNDLLVLQDTSEPLRELSRADLRSMEIVGAAADNYDPWADSHVLHAGPHPAHLYGTAVAPTTGSKSSGGNGIRIKTHQERLRESSTSSEKGSVDGSSDGGGQQSVRDAPTPTEEGGADSREFHKSGGLALFDDIA